MGRVEQTDLLERKSQSIRGLELPCPPPPPVSKFSPPSRSENHGELYLVLPQPLHRLTERIWWLGAISLEEVNSFFLLQVASSV